MIAIGRAHKTGTVDLGESSEGWLSRPFHPAAVGLVWRGRTLDLSKAYKHVPIDIQSQQTCVLGYLHEGKWYFTLQTGYLLEPQQQFMFSTE